MAVSLRVGQQVEVRSEAEILATLDSSGTVGGLPLMPEMLAFCGQRFRVAKRAEKVCDCIVKSVSRRMTDTVLLEALRCSGEAHGGCEARCRIFWKECWLRPVREGAGPGPGDAVRPRGIARQQLLAVTVQSSGADGETIYRCQATEMYRATSPLSTWDPRQYLRELSVGNVGVGIMLKTLVLASHNLVARRIWRFGIRPRPAVHGLLTRTPRADLRLQPGERVRVRPLAAICATLDRNHRNQGLFFDIEMATYCEREFTVRARIGRLIDEHTGRMVHLKTDVIELEGVHCTGLLSEDRLFCPRNIILYWREAWLQRVPSGQPSSGSQRQAVDA